MQALSRHTGIKIGLLYITSNLLLACGPIYHTDYAFTPPESQTGKMCIYQCENGRTQCQQIEDLRVQQCEFRADLEQDRCEAQVAWEKDRDTKWYECWRDSCNADYERCDNSYRNCYQACGGKVEASTRCVANCNQAS